MSQSTLSLGRADQGIELSHAEFAKAYFDEPWRYERVQGRLVVISPADYEHQCLVERICKVLFRYKDEHPGIVEDVFTAAWFRIDEHPDRIADIGVFLYFARPRMRGLLAVLDKANVSIYPATGIISKTASGHLPKRVPELVMEVVSQESGDHQRDYVAKRLDYERAGVREYVIVDRFQRRVTVLHSVRGRFEEHVLAAGKLYATLLLPGLQIPLMTFIEQ